MKKLIFIAAAVIILDSVTLAQQAIDVNNPSFEYTLDGIRPAPGHSVIEEVLGWEDNAEGAGGWAGVDVMCPYANSNHCHRWPGPTDPCGTGTDVVYAYIQHDSGCNIYQILDMNNSDANGAIQEGRRYTLRWDALVGERGESGNQLRAVLFYLGDPCTPDVNHQVLASKVYTVLWIDRPLAACKGTSSLDDPGVCPDWNYDFRMDYVAQAAVDGNTLGIKFQSVGQMIDNYTFVDNVRLDWQWATQAYAPNPDDGAVEVSKDADLIWSPGLWTKSTNGHDVYFGSTWAEVNSATTASAEFQKVQSPNEFDPGTLTLGETYYWRIDEVNENYSYPSHGPAPEPQDGRAWKGEIWSFTVAGRAKNPNPPDSAVDDVPKNVILRWTAGAEALYHDVFFGTSESAVDNATTASSEYQTRLNLGTELYDAGTEENPQVGEQYFWRIDEVNTMTVKGNIWDFTVADYILVDDFDSYADIAALKGVWNDSTNGTSGDGIVKLNTDPNYAVDGNSMLLEYWNTKSPYYSETKRSYATGQDWSYVGAGVTALEIDFFGDVNSVPDPPMYVKLSDDTNTAQVNHDDGNDVTEQWQHTWVIPLNDFTNVNLSSITSITLGIGDGKGEGGPPAEQGTLYFDDIRLYPPRCFPDKTLLEGDFTEDCAVDINDLHIMVRDWLISEVWIQPPTPDTNGVIQYTFDEGTGTIVHNTGTWGDANGYDLTLGTDLDGNYEPNNDPCWVNDPCRGWCLYFDGEAGFNPAPDMNGGDYLVIPPLNVNSNTVSITAWLKPDPGLFDPKKGIYCRLGEFTGIVHQRDANTKAGIRYGPDWCDIGSNELEYDWDGISWPPWDVSGIPIPDWQWSFVALVVEPDQATIYLADANDPADPNDDVLRKAVNPMPHEPEEFDGRTIVGGNEYGSYSFFRGYVDDVRIYDHSLSEIEIKALAGIEEEICTLCIPPEADIDGDSEVNFTDFALMAKNWLDEKLWPEP